MLSPWRSGQRVALVIGNAAYAHAPVLATPLNDASDLGATLEHLGFTVTRVENADQAALLRNLRAFATASEAAEAAVVFYAGHGVTVDGRNFLLPVDARLSSERDIEFEAVPLALAGAVRRLAVEQPLAAQQPVHGGRGERVIDALIDGRADDRAHRPGRVVAFSATRRSATAGGSRRGFPRSVRGLG